MPFTSKSGEFEIEDDTEGLVEWAGMRITNSEQIADENPETHMLAPHL